MFPVVEFTVRPGGSPATPKLRGAFVAFMESENGRESRGLTVPLFWIKGSVAAIVNVMFREAVPTALTAFTFDEKTPSRAGMPPTSPVVALIDKPEGRPLAVKRVGEFVALTWKENKAPTAPLAFPELVISGIDDPPIDMASVRSAEVPAALEAVTAKVWVPIWDGMPEMLPFVVLSERPGGSNPAAMANAVGELLAEIFEENGRPMPPIHEEYEMTGGWRPAKSKAMWLMLPTAELFGPFASTSRRSVWLPAAMGTFEGA